MAELQGSNHTISQFLYQIGQFIWLFEICSKILLHNTQLCSKTCFIITGFPQLSITRRDYSRHVQNPAFPKPRYQFFQELPERFVRGLLGFPNILHVVINRYHQLTTRHQITHGFKIRVHNGVFFQKGHPAAD